MSEFSDNLNKYAAVPLPAKISLNAVFSSGTKIS